MNDTLNQYQVKFSTPANFAIYNKITTVNDAMSQIIGEHYTNYDANALLNGVNQVINGRNIDIVNFYSDSLILAVVGKTMTNIYEDFTSYENDDTITPYYSLPTQDFQVIVQAWRDYLAQSPGTK